MRFYSELLQRGLKSSKPVIADRKEDFIKDCKRLQEAQSGFQEALKSIAYSQTYFRVEVELKQPQVGTGGTDQSVLSNQSKEELVQSERKQRKMFNKSPVKGTISLIDEEYMKPFSIQDPDPQQFLIQEGEKVLSKRGSASSFIELQPYLQHRDIQLGEQIVSDQESQKMLTGPLIKNSHPQISSQQTLPVFTPGEYLVAHDLKMRRPLLGSKVKYNATLQNRFASTTLSKRRISIQHESNPRISGFQGSSSGIKVGSEKSLLAAGLQQAKQEAVKQWKKKRQLQIPNITINSGESSRPGTSLQNGNDRGRKVNTHQIPSCKQSSQDGPTHHARNLSNQTNYSVKANVLSLELDSDITTDNHKMVVQAFIKAPQPVSNNQTLDGPNPVSMAILDDSLEFQISNSIKLKDRRMDMKSREAVSLPNQTKKDEENDDIDLSSSFNSGTGIDGRSSKPRKQVLNKTIQMQKILDSQNESGAVVKTSFQKQQTAQQSMNKTQRSESFEVYSMPAIGPALSKNESVSFSQKVNMMMKSIEKPSQNITNQMNQTKSDSNYNFQPYKETPLMNIKKTIVASNSLKQSQKRKASVRNGKANQQESEYIQGYPIKSQSNWEKLRYDFMSDKSHSDFSRSLSPFKSNIHKRSQQKTSASKNPTHSETIEVQILKKHFLQSSIKSSNQVTIDIVKQTPINRAKQNLSEEKQPQSKYSTILVNTNMNNQFNSTTATGILSQNQPKQTTSLPNQALQRSNFERKVQLSNQLKYLTEYLNEESKNAQINGAEPYSNNLSAASKFLRKNRPQSLKRPSSSMNNQTSLTHFNQRHQSYSRRQSKRFKDAVQFNQDQLKKNTATIINQDINNILSGEEQLRLKQIQKVDRAISGFNDRVSPAALNKSEGSTSKRSSVLFKHQGRQLKIPQRQDYPSSKVSDQASDN